MKRKPIALSTTIASWTLKLSLSLPIAFILGSGVWAEVKETEINKPKVKQDEVTLRIQVRKEKKRPALQLRRDNFQILVDGEKVDIKNWTNPENNEPPPAKIIVLLDLTGSMKGTDQRNQSKLQGAVNAISRFVDAAENRGGNTEIAIVPFGVARPNTNCSQNYPVDNDALDNFFRAGDEAGYDELKWQLNNYLSKEKKLCTYTDLYNPLIKAVNFLGSKYPPPDPDSQEEESEPPQTPPPRLAVILLSDGYHTEGNEAEDFAYLKEELEQYSHIPVNTLGYGRTPEELGKTYKSECGGTPATRTDVGRGRCKVPESKFVDRQRLEEIADLTGGIASFSGHPQAIANALIEFLNSLLGEYEITYHTPKPERGKTYEVQVVVADEGSTAKSNSEYYRVIWDPLSSQTRFGIFICVLLVITVAGILPFWLWGKYIKEQELNN